MKIVVLNINYGRGIRQYTIKPVKSKLCHMPKSKKHGKKTKGRAGRPGAGRRGRVGSELIRDRKGLGAERRRPGLTWALAGWEHVCACALGPPRSWSCGRRDTRPNLAASRTQRCRPRRSGRGAGQGSGRKVLSAGFAARITLAALLRANGNGVRSRRIK